MHLHFIEYFMTHYFYKIAKMFNKYIEKSQMHEDVRMHIQKELKIT